MTCGSPYADVEAPALLVALAHEGWLDPGAASGADVGVELGVFPSPALGLERYPEGLVMGLHLEGRKRANARE